MSIKTPVYSLKKGDKFVGDDGRVWTVDEVRRPDDWNIDPQIGAKPKPYTVLCHIGQMNIRFYLHSCKLVERL